ncbi:MAG TPA: hypothetical protein VFL17_23030 [Anaerolineae bacterium]|nr:hypothetical protein [Anaerolineae bacterium]
MSPSREAIEWLEKATLAPRDEALRCYRKALEVMPEYEEAKQRLRIMLARMN